MTDDGMEGACAETHGIPATRNRHTFATRYVYGMTRHMTANGTFGGIRMKIGLTSVYVDDQERALEFYTKVLGFTKKADVKNGPYRWLTVASPDQPDGTQLQLVSNDNPAAKAYQQAIFQQGQPAAMF